MPVSVVVGGQFGSEGKGKVALDRARRANAAAVVRVGGTNSGHTGVGSDGRSYALRQLPAAALAGCALVILPPGSLIDIEIFQREVSLLGLGPDQVKVDPMATVITEHDKLAEKDAGIVGSIGSTGSGTGAALQRRISRRGSGVGIQAFDFPELQPYLSETTSAMRSMLDRGRRIVIEGTQGFGLSLLHGGFYPKATSRDTTAGTFVAEAGLSPLDVDEIILVIRTFPIRVAGDSGRLSGETTWAEVAKQAGLPTDYHELTTATRKVRRVGRFDAEVVRRAIAVNRPTEVVLNHFDYVDASARTGEYSARVCAFLQDIERQIDHRISLVGMGPASLVARHTIGVAIMA